MLDHVAGRRARARRDHRRDRSAERPAGDRRRRRRRAVDSASVNSSTCQRRAPNHVRRRRASVTSRRSAAAASTVNAISSAPPSPPSSSSRRAATRDEVAAVGERVGRRGDLELVRAGFERRGQALHLLARTRRSPTGAPRRARPAGTSRTRGRTSRAPASCESAATPFAITVGDGCGVWYRTARATCSVGGVGSTNGRERRVRLQRRASDLDQVQLLRRRDRAGALQAQHLAVRRDARLRQAAGDERSPTGSRSSAARTFTSRCWIDASRKSIAATGCSPVSASTFGVTCGSSWRSSSSRRSRRPAPCGRPAAAARPRAGARGPA